MSTQELSSATVVVASDASDEQTNLDKLATNLTRACAFLLVLSVLRVGRLEGLFAFVATAFVLLCAAPGAKGMARATRRTRIFAALAAIFALITFVKSSVALAYQLPHEVAVEARLHCDSMPEGVAEGLVQWGHAAWRTHHRLHYNRTWDDKDEEDGGGHFRFRFMKMWLGAADEQNATEHFSTHLASQQLKPADGTATAGATSLVHGTTGERVFARKLHGTSDTPWAFSKPAFCAKAEKVVRCTYRAALVASAVLALLTFLAAAHVSCRARQLARAAGLGCAWKKRCAARSSAAAEAQQPLVKAMPMV